MKIKNYINKYRKKTWILLVLIYSFFKKNKILEHLAAPLIVGIIVLFVSDNFQKRLLEAQQKYDLYKFQYELKIKTIESFSKLANNRYLLAERFMSVPCNHKISKTEAWINYLDSVTTWNQYLDMLTPQIQNSFSNTLSEKIISNNENVSNTLHGKFYEFHLVLSRNYINEDCRYPREARILADNIANIKKELVIEMQNEAKTNLELIKQR